MTRSPAARALDEADIVLSSLAEQSLDEILRLASATDTTRSHPYDDLKPSGIRSRPG